MFEQKYYTTCSCGAKLFVFSICCRVLHYVRDEKLIYSGQTQNIMMLYDCFTLQGMCQQSNQLDHTTWCNVYRYDYGYSLPMNAYN